MKRSEMLSIIAEAINPCISAYDKHKVSAAQRVLDEIEKAGMLPPHNKKQIPPLYYHEMHEWEREP